MTTPAVSAEAAHVVAVPVCGAGVSPYACGAVAETLAHATGYVIRVCGPDTPVAGAGGVVLRPGFGLEELTRADTVVVCAVPDPRTDRCPGWVPLLREAAASGTRLVGTGTGVFALAEAGLLDGRHTAVHWPHAAVMAELFPQVLIEADAILTTTGAGGVVTAAGGSCVLDACLHVIRVDHGPAVAARVARELLVPGIRAGGQRGYAAPEPIDPTADAALGGLLTLLAGYPARAWTIDAIAAAAGVSPRTLHRRFTAATGRAPLDWLIDRRVHAAQLLLADTDDPHTTIAAATGFDSVASLRHHFRRLTGLAPGQYRRTFRTTP